MPTIEKVHVRDVIALDASTSCQDASHLMEARRASHPMERGGSGSVGVRKEGEFVGLVTEGDLVYGVMAEGEGMNRPIGELVRTDVPAVPPTATERDCAHLVQAHFTRHLLVKQGDAAVGVVSMINVLSLMLEDNRWLIEQLHTYIRGGRGG